jgi:hypothetical protein
VFTSAESALEAIRLARARQAPHPG